MNNFFSSALVTGANGFIGLHLVRRLETIGIRVNVLDKKSDKLRLVSKANIFEGEIFDNELVKKAVKDVEVVFHLIGKTHDFSNAKENTEDFFKINVEGTRNVLNSCIESKIRHFVFFSSVKTMAEVSEYILDETCIPHPTTPYGVTKLLAEKLVEEYGKKYGFKTTSIRLPLVYGPGNKGNIFKVIDSIDRSRFVLMGKGENKRSMVYVGNAVDAAIAAAGREEEVDKVYIVTDGIDYTVRELYETIAESLGKRTLSFHVPISIAKGLAWLGDLGGHIIRRSLPFNSETLNKLANPFFFSSTKIQQDLGFSAKYSLFNTIDETIGWYKQYKAELL